MLARLIAFFDFQQRPHSDQVTESPAYRLGYDTAHKNWADNNNPFPAGTQEHADWAEGQFVAGAERQW